MDSSQTLPPDFDPWVQPITLYRQDGTNFTIGMDSVNILRLYGARLGINYGSQTGASFILLLVLLLLTKAEKRKSFVFIINTLCLCANTVRCVLFCCYLTGSLWHPYSQLSVDWSRVKHSDVATIVAANTMTLLVTTLIMISLSTQVWTVCVTTMPLPKYIIMAVTTTIAAIALGYKAAFMILLNKQALAFRDMQKYENVIAISYVLQSVSIWLFSCVFTYKLGYAIVQRHRLKMPQFGPMQIVFIMGFQTMIIPAIFTTFQFNKRVPELGSQVLTIVSIFLPLSAIWAGVSSNSNVASSGPDSHQRLIHSEFYRSSPSNTANGSSYMGDKSRGMSVTTSKGRDIDSMISTPSPRKKSNVHEEGIHVGQEFGFTHYPTDDRV